MSTDEKKLSAFLKILADENKLKIVLHLMKGEECVCNLAEKVGVERTLVSYHLKTLREAGLICDRKLGTWIHYSLNKPEFTKLSVLLSTYLSPEVISNKICTIHQECLCLTKGDTHEE